MKILVTGGTGFIGTAFIKAARAAGHEVAALTRQPHPDEHGLHFIPGILADVPWATVEKFAPDACLHAAWVAEPGVYLESPLNDDYVRWSLDFLRGLSKIGVPYALGLGTCIEYAVTGEPMREDETPLAPSYPYSRAKDALRRAVEDKIACDAFRFGWGRVFYPYGPGEHPARLGTTLARKVLAGEPILLKTPNSTKDYIYIDDLAAAILAVLERRLTGAVNLGTGTGVPVRQLARTLARFLDREDLVTESDFPAPDPLHYIVADTTRLRVETRWAPAHDLATGLRALLKSLHP